MDTTSASRNQSRLLVVAPNWLGDLVMATVLLEALARFRSAQSRMRFTVSLAVRRRWMPLVTGDPRVDELLPHEREGRHRGLRGMGRLAAQWRAAGCRSAILLPPSLRVALAARLAGIRSCVGQRSDGRSGLLSHPVSMAPRGTVHFTDQMLLLGRAWVQAHADVAGCALWDRTTAQLQPCLPACEGIPAVAELKSGPPLWILGPGATYGEAKTWPPEQVAAFLRAAVTMQKVRVALLGDAASLPLAARYRRLGDEAWRGGLAGGPGVIDLVGKTGLESVVGLLKGAALFVGCDSGLMHLAAALGTPTLGLFGSTSPAWTGPRGRKTAVLAVQGFACQPCFRRRCNQKVHCMSTLESQEVLAAAQRLLGQPEPGAWR